MKLVIKIEKKLIIKTSIKIHHQNHMNSLAESRENNYYDIRGRTNTMITENDENQFLI